MRKTGSSYLIVKLAAAGDVLLFTAAAETLRRARPEAYIAWLTTDYCAPLLRGNGDVDEILRIPKGARTQGVKDRIAAVLTVWTKLRRWKRQHADATVILGHRSRGLAILCRAAGFNVAGFDPRRDGRGLRLPTIGLKVTAPFDPAQHRLNMNAGLLLAAGIEPALGGRPRIVLDREEYRLGAGAWPEADGLRWVLAPGGASNPWSAMPNRRWPRERFLELARRARREGFNVRLVGGPEDAAINGWIADQLQAPEANLTNKFSIRKTAAVIAAADLVIGNDSLPLILAHAVRCPGLGLFGPTDGKVIHAGPGRAVQGAVDCGPCYDPRDGLHGCAYTCPRAICMEALSIDDVWRAALRLSPPHPSSPHGVSEASLIQFQAAAQARA